MYSSYKRDSIRKEMMASSSKPPSPTQSAKNVENAPASSDTPPPPAPSGGEAEGEERGKSGVPSITISKDPPKQITPPPLVSSPLPYIAQDPVDTSNVLSNSFRLPRPETSKVHVRSPVGEDARQSTASVGDARPTSSGGDTHLGLRNPLTSHVLHQSSKGPCILPPVASASHIQTMFGKNGVFTITNNNLTKTQPIISQQPMASFIMEADEALMKSSLGSSQKGSAESTRTLPRLSSITSSSAGRRRDEGDVDSLNKFRRKNRRCCEGMCDAASVACCICCDCCHCDLCCLLCRICTAV